MWSVVSTAYKPEQSNEGLVFALCPLLVSEEIDMPEGGVLFQEGKSKWHKYHYSCVLYSSKNRIRFAATIIFFICLFVVLKTQKQTVTDCII